MGPFRRLIPYILRYRRAFLLGLGCVVVTSAIALSSPWVLKFAVDDLQRGVTRNKLALYAGLLLGIAAAAGCFRFLMRRVLIGASRHIEYDLRNDFFAKLEQFPVAYYQSRRTGDLMSRATNDLNAVRMMVGPAVMYSASTLITFVVGVTVMLRLNPWLTGIALIPLPFISISVKLFGGAIHRSFEQVQAQLSDVSAVVQESLAGVRVVRAYRREEVEIERFAGANREYLRRNRRLIRLQGMFFPSMTLFLGLAALLVLWLGSREVIRGRITLGEFVAFNGYLAMLSWPMIAFGWVTNMLQRGMASWKRMLEVLDTVPAITDAEATTRVTSSSQIRGAIEFRRLVFAYDGRVVLDDISARIEPGQTAAIVGVTGAGKSTLVNLLARLRDPPRGTVFIDGVDVREIPLAVLRGAIGFVSQEPFLFSDTVAENVAFGGFAVRPFGSSTRSAGPGSTVSTVEPSTSSGAMVNPSNRGKLRVDVSAGELRQASPDRGSSFDRTLDVRSSAAGRHEIDAAATRQAVERASAIARLDKDVETFPNRYETIVGERGITLSGGQKQRTAIARALFVDPRILILDDALSAVDTYTEEEILSRLRPTVRQRTAIIISHRISTVQAADQILVLDKGRLVEQGRHEELIDRDGPYARLYRRQLLEEELAVS